MIATPVGILRAGTDGNLLNLLEFDSEDRLMRQKVERFDGPSESPLLDELEAQLAAYFRRELTAFTIPWQQPGTDFQQRVWAKLCEIPYGETWSYLDLAKAVGSAAAVRAVGRANGSNRIAIVVPCHRVVQRDGSMGGYGGGIDNKARLLRVERAGLQASLPL